MRGPGRLLDVNLETGQVVKKEIEPGFARTYVGGMGFGCRMLLDEVVRNIDPLGPENILVFANGPLTGTGAPCAGRTEITNKSPLTGNIGTGNTGGVWGARLKHAGFEAIIVRGKAHTPVYLCIDDDAIELRQAGHLWGKDTVETTDLIKDELKSMPTAPVSVMCIGPAGENRVRFACPVNDYYHVAARGGAGAVMGSKGLKAIAVRGTGRPAPVRPDEFRKASREARERLIAAKNAEHYPGAPTDPRNESLLRGCMQGRNYQSGILPRWTETRGAGEAHRYKAVKAETCWACPISCFDLVTVPDGKYTGAKANRAYMPGVVMDWGANCAIESIPAIWKCKELCHKLGMDYVSASGSIAFAMELYQRGILTTADTGGLCLSWGNEEATIELLHRIAWRKGFGDILAEGSSRAAKIIGSGAGRYVMAIKGMEMMLPDPRAGRRGWLFGSLTNPRGGDNVKNTHCHAERYNPNWWHDKFDMFDDVKEKIYGGLAPGDIADTWQGKPAMAKWFEDLYSVANSLGLCFFPSGFQLALGPTYLARLYSSYMGEDVSSEELMQLGERVFTLFKVCAVRQGFTRKDDTWPDRFFDEPITEGPARGAILSRQTIGRLLDEYYDLRGWDQKSGAPSPERLAALGLSDIAGHLA